MHHGPHAVERQGVPGDIGFDEAEPRPGAQHGEVGFLYRARIKRVEVVDADDLVTPGDERLAHV